MIWKGLEREAIRAQRQVVAHAAQSMAQNTAMNLGIHLSHLKDLGKTKCPNLIAYPSHTASMALGWRIL